jgi:hypothetical protein
VATYLAITNELLRRLNEVTIAQDDFPNVRNIQALAKDAVNASIRGILQSAQEWPFTLVTYTETLVDGTQEYDFPADMSSVDWDSFYLKQLEAENNYPTKLDVLTYAEYLDRFRADDDVNGEDGRAAPIRVYQTQEERYGLSPVPNAAYELEYKYWSFPSDLTAFDDTPVIPNRFKHVIIDGAMAYMMRFRSNEQSAMIHQNNYSDGIAMMRRLLMDDPIDVRSTYIIPNFYQRVVSR